jgi:hypothetical protein
VITRDLDENQHSQKKGKCTVATISGCLTTATKCTNGNGMETFISSDKRFTEGKCLSEVESKLRNEAVQRLITSGCLPRGAAARLRNLRKIWEIGRYFQTSSRRILESERDLPLSVYSPLSKMPIVAYRRAEPNGQRRLAVKRAKLL